MHLLDLSTLVKDRIFKYMEVHEIFLLSACSKKTNLAIKTSEFRHKYDGIKFISETYIKGSIAVCCAGNEDFKTVLEWENQRKKSKSQMKIDGLTIKCRIKYHSKTGVPIIYIEEYQRTTPVALYNYVNDLLQTTSIMELRLRRSDFSDFPESLKVARNVVMDSYCQYANTKFFEDFFEKVKVQNCFVSEQCLRGAVSEGIKMMATPNLLLDHATWLLPQHLYRFTGKNAFFENTKLKNADLNQFVKLWQNGNIAVGLESLIVSTENIYRYNETLNGIDRVQWNPNIRAKKFIYKAAFRDFFQKEFDFLDCSDSQDLERSTDKMLASVKILSETKSGITRHYFLMFVWHLRFPDPDLFQNNEPGFRFL